MQFPQNNFDVWHFAVCAAKLEIVDYALSAHMQIKMDDLWVEFACFRQRSRIVEGVCMARTIFFLDFKRNLVRETASCWNHFFSWPSSCHRRTQISKRVGARGFVSRQQKVFISPLLLSSALKESSTGMFVTDLVTQPKACSWRLALIVFHLLILRIVQWYPSPDRIEFT